MYDGRAVANWVLDAYEERGTLITNLALQKIVYFCHVRSLVRLGQPMIGHEFEAWEHGPVLPYLYHEFKHHGAEPINSRAQHLDVTTGKKVIAAISLKADEEKVLIDSVRFCARLTSTQLVKLSHIRGGPWWKTWKHKGDVNPGMKISNPEIKQFYSRVRPFID